MFTEASRHPRNSGIYPQVSASASRSLKLQRPVIVDSCRIKADVVSKDERESGLRRTLNYGHTVGHALEAVTKYRRFLHGEATHFALAAGRAAPLWPEQCRRPCRP